MAKQEEQKGNPGNTEEAKADTETGGEKKSEPPPDQDGDEKKVEHVARGFCSAV